MVIPTSLFAQEFEFTFTPEEIYLPLIIDGRYVGEINSLPMEEMDTEVDIVELASFLTDRISEEKLTYFTENPEQWAAIADLQDAPVIVTFNMFDLLIEVFIPPENTKSQDISLLGAKDPLIYPEIEPSRFSMYTNIYSNGSITMGYDSSSFEISTPISFILEPSLNFSGWTLESRFTTSLFSDTAFSFGYARLLRDWADLPFRLMLGDITYESAPNQSSPAYLGAVISRNYANSFKRKSYSNYTHSFLVPEDNVLVNIFLNNRRIKAVDMNAGMYTINDFYFNNGVNDFKIQLTNPDGEEVAAEEFLFAYDNALTPPGQTEYAFGAGFKNRDLTAWPEVFGMQTFGISDHMSGQYFFQAGDNQQNIGLSTVWAANLGNFKLNTAVSRTADENLGLLASLNYRHVDANSLVNRAYTFTGTYTSDHYTSFSNTDSAASQTNTWKLSGSYGQTILGAVSASTTGRITFEKDGTVVSPSLSLSLRARLSREFGVTASYTGAWDTSLSYNPTFKIAANYSPRNADFSISADQDVLDGSNTVNVSYTPTNLNGDLALGLNMSDLTIDDPLPDSANLSAGIKHSDFLLDADLKMNRSGNSSAYTIDLGLDTAFSYADGLFGVSRPISDSFVLVAPEVQVPGLIIGVNPSGDSYKGRTDDVGAAVINGLSSFTEHAIVIEPIEIPDGFEIGSDNYTFRPTYHQAGTVKIGVDANVTVMGKMLFSDGTPVALYSGEILEEGAVLGPDEFPEFFFTYTDGTFEFYGLHSGSHIVTLYAGEGLEFTLVIPEGLTGIYQAKDVIIPVEYKTF